MSFPFSHLSGPARAPLSLRKVAVPKLKPLRCVVNAVQSSEDLLIKGKVSVGIDLGTTNSVVAIVTEQAGPFCLPIHNNENLMPSIVAFTSDQAVLVGNAAKQQASSNPDNTFYSVKRIIGKEYSSVAKV